MIDALVIGRSLPALVAALELAEVGLRVTVVDAAVAEAEADRDRSAPAGPEQDPDGVLAGLVRRVLAPLGAGAGDGNGEDGGEAEEIPDPAQLSLLPPPETMLLDRQGAWAPLPDPSVLGIPAVPLAEASIRLLGTGDALRGYLDRVLPLLTIRKPRSLGEMVRRRVGPAVLERMVDPIVTERYGVPASEVESAIVAPGLAEAFSRSGALGAGVLAYSERNAVRETRIEPAGGWTSFAARLHRRLSLYGVEFANAPAESALRTDAGWRVELADGQTLEAQALIADLGDDTEPPAVLPEAARALAPETVRVYAEIDMDRPAWLGEGQSAVRRLGDRSLRVEALEGASGEGIARARLSSAVLESPCPALDHLLPALEATLAQAGLGAAPGAVWRIRCAAAPFATRVARDAAAAALAAVLEEDQCLLPVGRALHGDRLPAAVESASEGAVALRRRLLGLVD